jgi:sorbitol-specific phosphotransferase system component IIBC
MKHKHKICGRYVELDTYRRDKQLKSTILNIITFIGISAVMAIVIAAGLGSDITKPLTPTQYEQFKD